MTEPMPETARKRSLVNPPPGDGPVGVPSLSRSLSPRRGFVLVVLLVLMILAASTGAGVGRAPVPPGSVPRTRAILPVAKARVSYSNNGVTPSPRSFAASTYDAAEGYVLMFGGLNSQYTPLSSTWSFEGNNWTDLSSSVGPAPSARWGASLVYDPVAGFAVLFGGCLNATCSRVADDTWTFADGHWANITSSLGIFPEARGEAMMTYDAQDRYVLLFGGVGPGGTLLNDTWAFSDGAWNQVPTGLVAPRPRYEASMAYDPSISEVMLFGGFSNSNALSGTWSYSGGRWDRISTLPSSTPAARGAAPLVYDGTDGYLLLLNGRNETTVLGSEWSFTDTWVPLSPPGHPPPTYGALLVYDPLDHYVVFFSGLEAPSVILGSTLVYSSGAWTLLINPVLPVPLTLFLWLGVSTGLFLLLLCGLLIMSRLSRLRRAGRRASTSFDLRPGAAVRWVKTGGQGKEFLRGRYHTFLALVGSVLGGLSVAALLVATPLEGGFLFVGTSFLPVFLLVALVTPWVMSQDIPVEVGIAEPGLVYRRKRAELRLPWTHLQPATSPPTLGWFKFRYSWSESSGGSDLLPVTVEQARATLESEFAPPWPIVPEVAAALGVPVTSRQRTSSPSNHSPAAPAPLGALPPTDPDLPGATTAGGIETPHPPRVNSGGTPQGLPRAAGSVTSGVVPPGSIRCSKCGADSPPGRIFCLTCGQRLPRQ